MGQEIHAQQANQAYTDHLGNRQIPGHIGTHRPGRGNAKQRSNQCNQARIEKTKLNALAFRQIQPIVIAHIDPLDDGLSLFVGGLNLRVALKMAVVGLAVPAFVQKSLIQIRPTAEPLIHSALIHISVLDFPAACAI